MKKIPKDALAELLIYIAEHETFASLKDFSSFKPAEVRFALKELAMQLKKELQRDGATGVDIAKLKGIDKRTKQILSALSPRESKLLLRAFSIDG